MGSQESYIEALTCQASGWTPEPNAELWDFGEMVSITDSWEEFLAEDNSEIWWAIFRRMETLVRKSAERKGAVLGPITWEMMFIPNDIVEEE